MFFTRMGKIIAHVIFWLGALQVILGFVLAFGTLDMESNRAASGRYLAAETTGEAIETGLMAIVLAVALGVLCEISTNRRKSDEQTGLY